MKVIVLILVLASLVLTGTASGNDHNIRHSYDVLRFFDNHSWLKAPNQKKCKDVPWQRSCTIARRLVRVHEQKVYEYNYDWEKWLPYNWQGVARCETHFNWEHSNSVFVSAFGISWREYNADAAYMGAPPWHVRHTPRDQYLAALGHYARFGDGWTCPGP